MAIKYTFNMSDADIKAGMASIKKRSATIRKDTHSLAVSILTRWAKMNDVKTAAEQATKLVESMDPSHAQKAVNWFATYASFEWVDTDEGKCFGYDGDRTTIDVKEVQAARAETMFDLTKDAKVKPLDFPARLKSLLAQAKKHRGDGLVEGDNVPDDLVKAVEALVA